MESEASPSLRYKVEKCVTEISGPHEVYIIYI